MAGNDELYSALANADAAGDTQGAKVLADHIRSLSAPAPPPPGALEQIGHQLGLTGRMGITALTSLPNMAGDFLNGAINLGVQGVNAAAGTNIPSLQYPSQITQRAMDAAGVSQPQNMQERLVQAAGSAAGASGPSVLLGKLLAKGGSALAGAVGPDIAKALGAGLQAAPGVQAVSGAGSGVGSQAAAEAGFGPVGQIAGAILGGGATALGATGAKALAAPSAATVKAQQYASALRDQAQNIEPMPVPDVKPWIKTNPDGTKTDLNLVPDVKPRFKMNVDGSMSDMGGATAAPAAPPQAVMPAAPQFNQPAPIPQGGMRPVQGQLDTIALLKKIGLDDQRPATISGDRFGSGIDFENSKLANPIGEVTRGQLAKEQTALKSYAGGIVQDAGGQAPSPEAMGQAIRAPMQGLSDHFDSAIGQLYDAAKTKAGDLGPVNPRTLNALMTDHGFRETLLSSTDGTSLLGSIDRQVKRFQGIPIPGEELPPAPNTVNSAENLRKWLNSQWSPGNSKMLGRVKEALDTDVATAGGAGVFDQARALHGLRRNTLDNPNGIGKLMTSDGPNGINQAIPDELVGPKLLTMPTNQFGHIVTMLKELPEGLQPAGQQALSEIKTEIARRVYKAGDSGGTQNGPSVWNAANVTRELNANKSKMALVFSPDELDKFQTLHDAGHVIQTPMAYKGAAAQGYNYLQKGVLTGLPASGAGLGAWLGGPLGAGVGSALGAGASAVAKGRVDATMAQRLAEQLRNPMPTFTKQ